MTLKEAKVGSTYTVAKITGAGAIKRRIMDMGITKGIASVHPQGCSARRSGRGYRSRL